MDPNGSCQKNVDLYGSILKKWIQLGRLKKVDPEELLLPPLQYGIAVLDHLWPFYSALPQKKLQKLPQNWTSK